MSSFCLNFKLFYQPDLGMAKLAEMAKTALKKVLNLAENRAISEGKGGFGLFTRQFS
jgi:hypothetical protein